jgi:tryptophan synthase alpha chain
LERLLKKNGLDCVHLLTPTSDDGRVSKAVKQTSGFVYYVSLTGVTGAKLTQNAELEAQIERIRSKTKLPLAIGFGISKPEQVRQLAPFADGVVIGSALVKLIHHHSKKPHGPVSKFISSFRRALDSLV